VFTKTIKYFWIVATLLLLNSCKYGGKQDEALVLQNTYNFNKKPKEEQNFYNNYYENSNQIKNIEKKIVYKAEPKPTPKPKPEIKKPEPVLAKPKDEKPKVKKEEVVSPKPKPTPTPAPKPKVVEVVKNNLPPIKKEVKPEVKPEIKKLPEPEIKKQELKPEVKPEVKIEPKVELKPEEKKEAIIKELPEPIIPISPQIKLEEKKEEKPKEKVEEKSEEEKNYDSGDLYKISADEIFPINLKPKYGDEPEQPQKPQTEEPQKEIPKEAPKEVLKEIPVQKNQIEDIINYDIEKKLRTKILSVFRGKLIIEKEFMRERNAKKLYTCEYYFLDEAGKLLITEDIGNGYTLVESDRAGKIFLDRVECVLPYFTDKRARAYYFKNLFFYSYPAQINYIGDGDFVWASGHLYRTAPPLCPDGIPKEEKIAGKLIPNFENQMLALLDYLAYNQIDVPVAPTLLNALLNRKNH
jgi:hypothetical protein